MKPAIRWTLGIVAGIFGLIVIALLILFFNLNTALKHAVEQGGTYALGVETTIDSVNLDIFAGELTLTNLNVANPEGFSEKPFMNLQHAQVKVDTSTLTSDLVQVGLLAIDGFDVSLEIRDEQNNYDVILANLERFSSGDTAQPAEPSTQAIAVDKIDIRNVKADADVKLTGSQQRTVQVNLPPIVLTDFRSDADQGPMIGQLTGVITRAILSAVLRQGADLLPAIALGSLEEGLDSVGDASKAAVKGLGDAGKAAVQEVLSGGEGARGTLDNIGDNLENAGRDVGNAVGNLFRRNNNNNEENNEQTNDEPASE
ncbi:AsmA family protein [Mucisphaera sp.]|uniref:AsmA family protein n=1 Tax=Mucisphaera sp. TaxID=2913024 RepID=UPI003D0D0B03